MTFFICFFAKSQDISNILHIASWYPMPDDPRLGNFVEQHLLAIHSQNPVVLLSAFPSSKNEVIYRKEPFPQVQVLYKKRLSLFSHYRALKKGYRFLRSQGYEFNLAHLHVCHPSGIAFLGFLRKMSFVVSEHYSGYHPSRLKEWSTLGQKIARKVFHKAHLMLPVSDALGQSLQNFGVQTDYKVVGNVVDTDIFHYQGPPTTSDFTFLHISSLQEHTKNIRGILQAFKTYKLAGGKAKLKIGGDGKLSALKEKIKDLDFDVDSIEVLPAMSATEVSQQMQNSHCFVLFSWIENQPVVLLEALCSGRPFIATQVGGIDKIGTTDQRVLIEAGDETALVDSFFHMESHYADYDLKRIANEAAAQHGKKVISEAFNEVYASVRPSNY